ncbi:MAG: leucine-rich repeat protein, partial [Bacteroidales bacterium]|nr:leucine-rich repeat protein [Bacteroidales bacterium]
RSLSAGQNQLKDVTNLADIKTLTWLRLQNNQIEDVSFLSELPDLYWVDLSFNLIDSIPSLSCSTSLEYLYLNNNRIEEIDSLGSMEELRRLYLSQNRIRDISCLSGSPKLRELKLDGNRIRDISALAGNSNLTSLYLANNELIDIGDLVGLTNLWAAYLNNNKIVNIAGMRDLPNLRRIDLSENRLQDVNSLSEFSDLEYVNLLGNPLDSVSCANLLQIRYSNPVVCIKTDINCPSTPPDARVYYVDADADVGGDGSSWDRAFQYLQDALVQARYGDEIRVAEGIYRPDEASLIQIPKGLQAASFQLKNNVALLGGFAGMGTKYPNHRDVNRYQSVLSGDLSENDEGLWWDPSRHDNTCHLVRGDGTDSTAVLDGFILSSAGGAESHSGTGIEEGGGIFIYDGYPTIKNCTFIDNMAVSGGGIYYHPPYLIENASMRVVNCTFSHNWSHGGAAVAMWNGSHPTDDNASRLILENCVFFENSSFAGAGVSGKHIQLVNCVFNHHQDGESAVTFEGSGQLNRLEAEHFIHNVTIDSGTPFDIKPYAASFRDTVIQLEGYLDVNAGIMDFANVILQGPGIITLDKQTLTRINESVYCYVDINGPGDIQIPAGQEFTLAGNAILD